MAQRATVQQDYCQVDLVSPPAMLDIQLPAGRRVCVVCFLQQLVRRTLATRQFHLLMALLETARPILHQGHRVSLSATLATPHLAHHLA